MFISIYLIKCLVWFTVVYYIETTNGSVIMNQDTINKHFETLEEALKEYPVTASDFMLMNETWERSIDKNGRYHAGPNIQVIHFKHSMTRDYLFLIYGIKAYVSIPQTCEPFRTGSFLNQ